MELWNNRLEAAAPEEHQGKFARLVGGSSPVISMTNGRSRASMPRSGSVMGHLDLIMDSLDRLASLADRFPATVIECTRMMTSAEPGFCGTLGFKYCHCFLSRPFVPGIPLHGPQLGTS